MLPATSLETQIAATWRAARTDPLASGRLRRAAERRRILRSVGGDR